MIEREMQKMNEFLRGVETQEYLTKKVGLVDDKDAVCLVRFCHDCHTPYEIYVGRSDYYDYECGAMTQDAFPYLDTAIREMLISGMCPKCQQKMYELFGL